MINKLFVILLLLACNTSICQDKAPTSAGIASEIAIFHQNIKAAKHDSIALKYTSSIASTYLEINLDSAYKYLILSNKIAKRVPLSSIKLSYWNTCGTYYLYKRDFKSANHFQQMALDSAIKIKNDKYTKVLTYNMISQQANTGDFIGAIKSLYGFKVLLDSTHEQSKIYYSMLYGDLAVNYYAIKNTQKAIEFIQKELLYCENKADTLYYYIRLFETVHTIPHWYSTSIQLYNKGIQLAKELQNTQLKLRFLVGIAELHNSRGAYLKALEYAKISEGIAQKQGFEDYLFYAAQNKGQAYVGLRDYKRAIPYLMSTINQFRLVNDNYSLLKSLQSISQAYWAIGNYKEANKANVEYITINEKITAKEKQQTTAELEVRFEVNEQEKLLKVNQLALALQKKQIQTEYNQKVLISIFLVIAILLAIVAFRNYLKKNKLNNALTEEKKQVEIQAQQLSELNSLKDKLFAVIGHDLRSPIASLQLNIQQLHHSMGVSPTLMTSLSKLQNKVNTISDILNNLLDWSVSQIKGELLVKKTLNLHGYIKEALSLYETIIERKNLIIANQTPSDINIYFNESQLEALLRNLISNALKFTPTNGVIRIYTNLTLPNYTTLIIKDSGVGMSAEKLTTIFSHPTSELGTAGEQGSGLGLRVCNDILVLQNGKIKIESQTGIGTKVSISFLNDNVTNRY